MNNNSIGLNHLHLDAIREIANIGSGHAATSLSMMINRATMLTVPVVKVCPLESVDEMIGQDPTQNVAGVLLHIIGEITGRILLLFPMDSALTLPDLLMQRAKGTTKELTELEKSCLTETGNILASSYLIALGQLLDTTLQPSPPQMVFDMISAILTSALLDFSDNVDSVIYIETDLSFGESNEKLKTHFLLLPDTHSLNFIFKKLNIK